METLHYIAQLESRTRFVPAPEQLEKLTACESKNAINKLFFEMMAMPRAKAEMVFVDLQDALKASIERAKQERINVHRADMRQALEQAARYHRDAQDYVARASECRKNIFEVAGPENVPSFKAILDEIMADPFWTVAHISSQGQVTFHTPHVIMRYKNDKQSMDMTVNLGRMQLNWFVNTNKLVFAKLDENIDVEGYWHPHIGTDGKMCLGNGAATVHKALMEFRIHDALKVMQTILETYNPDSPYIRINEFWGIQNKEKIQGVPIVYVLEGKAWFWEDYCDENLDADFIYDRHEESEYEDEDSDGHRGRYRILVYHAQYEGLGVRADDKLYCKLKDDTYEVLDEGEMDDWA